MVPAPSLEGPFPREARLGLVPSPALGWCQEEPVWWSICEDGEGRCASWGFFCWPHSWHMLTARSEAGLDACGGKGRWRLWEPR